MYDIVVLGAGIVGLSTAINVQQRLPGRHVTLIAEKFTRETTSDGAAGIFRPTLEKTPAKSEQQFRKWCKDSFDWFHSLNTGFDPAETGILRVTGYQLNDAYTQQLPFHHDIIYDFRELTQSELGSLPGNKRHGWKYTTLMTESRRYLPWLIKRFVAGGGIMETRKINNINEFADKCTVLVNCCGLGAAELFNDPEVFPVRGHLLRITAPWIKHFYVWDGGMSYIYPGQDNVVIGGTRQKDEYDVTSEEKWFDDIIRKCSVFLPGIKSSDVQRKWVGLRPHRSYVRLEHETLVCGGKRLQVVHNYGHGANGIALSWGTAIEAAELVSNLPPTKRQKRSSSNKSVNAKL